MPPFTALVTLHLVSGACSEIQQSRGEDSFVNEGQAEGPAAEGAGGGSVQKGSLRKELFH